MCLRSFIHWFIYSTIPEFIWKRTETTSSAGSRYGCLVRTWVRLLYSHLTKRSAPKGETNLSSIQSNQTRPVWIHPKKSASVMPAYKTLSVYISLPQFTPEKLTVIILKWCGLYVLCTCIFHSLCFYQIIFCLRISYMTTSTSSLKITDFLFFLDFLHNSLL